MFVIKYFDLPIVKLEYCNENYETIPRCDVISADERLPHDGTRLMTTTSKNISTYDAKKFIPSRPDVVRRCGCTRDGCSHRK